LVNVQAVANRSQDPAVTKPGAGREAGETVRGKKFGAISGFFGSGKRKVRYRRLAKQ